MRIDGRWLRSDDGDVRPVVYAHVVTADGTRLSVVFLLDTGADRTVLNHRAYAALRHTAVPADLPIAGVGGLVEIMNVSGALWFRQSDGNVAVFRGRFGMISDPTALDFSVLGRDILQHFAVIVDQPGAVLSLINQNHRYAIVGR